MMAERDRPELAKRPDVVSLGLASIHVVFTLAPVYWAAALGPSLFSIVLCVWFGAAMHGLLNLMHEAAHWHVFRKRAHSDALGKWLLGPLVGSDFLAYRGRHWQHHRELGMTGDTKFTYRMGVAPRDLVRFVLRCFSTAEALGKLRHTGAVDRASETSAADATAGRRVPVWLLRTAVVQGLLVSSLFATACAFHGVFAALLSTACAYGFVYGYGLVAITSLVAAIRTVAEHHVGPDDVPSSGWAALRNFESGPITRLFLSGYGFAEHATHHQHPGVPAYRLRALTRRLCVDEPRLLPCAGYLATWRMLLAEESRDGLSKSRSA